MHAILTAHYAVGALVVLIALLLVWRRPGRRITLYVLTLQIALGIATAYAGYRPPVGHWLAAVIAWALLMAANGMQRRRRISSGTVRAMAAVATLLVLYAFYAGMHALRHAAT